MKIEGIKPGMWIDYNPPQGKPVSAIVTSIKQDKKRGLPKLFFIEGYNWEKFGETGKLTTYKIPHMPSTEKYITRNTQKENMLPKIGTIVECITSSGEKHRGIIKILKAGRPGIIYQGDPTRHMQYFGVISPMHPQPVPKTDPSSPMRDWSVSKYTENKKFSDETICYTADISYKKRVVLRAENSGQGEPDRFDIFRKGTSEDAKAFHEKCREWYLKYGKKEDCFEPESEWIRWEALYRPLGYTEKEHFDITNSISLANDA